jgi:hypothetical protein
MTDIILVLVILLAIVEGIVLRREINKISVQRDDAVARANRQAYTMILEQQSHQNNLYLARKQIRAECEFYVRSYACIQRDYGLQYDMSNDSMVRVGDGCLSGSKEG